MTRWKRSRQAVADFCRQCTLDIWDEDESDFDGIGRDGGMTLVLCEGCGDVYVDFTGTCLGGLTCTEDHRFYRMAEIAKIKLLDVM